MKKELSHEILRLLDRLTYIPSVKSPSHHGGRHISLRRGSSPEFREYREHRREDGWRAIDWKASARTGRHLVREKDHQGQLDHWLIVDSSASMGFPNESSSKFKHQALFCGALLYLFNGQGDKIGLIAEGHEQPPLWLEPSRGSGALDDRIGALSDLKPAGHSGVSPLLNQLTQRFIKPSLVWIFTDLDGDPASLMPSCRSLIQRGCEVHLLHLFLPDERDFPWTGTFVFEDCEHQYDELHLQGEDIHQNYREAYDNHIEQARRELTREGVLFSSIDLSTSPEEWLAQVFSETGNP